MDVYSQGRYSFAIPSLNLQNNLRKLAVDQGVLNSTLQGLSGYALDEWPFSSPDIGAQAWRRDLLSYSTEWALRSPLPLYPLTTQNVYLNSNIAFSLEFFFENSDFGELLLQLALWEGHMHYSISAQPSSAPKKNRR